MSLSKTGVSDPTLQAVRMLTASDNTFLKRSAADFAKQVDPLNEQAALQVMVQNAEAVLYLMACDSNQGSCGPATCLLVS